ncbi:hypothetical protein OAB56_03465 [Gammaproteobacteria bacterium]|nr:hypothetical protein [Gammaproteobacteria bacterium]
MNHSSHSVLISGAGQLGSRYLQGLAKCNLPLRIYVQDSFQESLDRSRHRWIEVMDSESIHEVTFHSFLEMLPKEIDITIVATTADSRPEVVRDISRHAVVRFWVLEKVLAQSEAGLDEIVSLIGKKSKAWVNTPRRMMPWHQQIKSQLDLTNPVTLEVNGAEWGLACNAIHFLDLLAWWTDESLQTVSTDRLTSRWVESKRQGSWEIFGTLEAKYSGGSCAVLSDEDGKSTISLEANDDQLSWLIEEVNGLSRRSDGVEILGRMLFQSEMSGSLVTSLIETGDCELPTLEESVELHRVFIGSMLGHWKKTVDIAATAIPIT